MKRIILTLLMAVFIPMITFGQEREDLKFNMLWNRHEVSFSPEFSVGALWYIPLKGGKVIDEDWDYNGEKYSEGNSRFTPESRGR